MLDSGHFFVKKEHGAVLKLALGGLGVGDEVGGDVSAVPLESFDVFDFSLKGFALGDGNSAVGSESIKDTGDKATDMLVVVGRDSGNVLDLCSGLYGHGKLLEAKDNLVDGHLDASSEVHRVHAGSNRFAAFLEDGTS